MDTLWEVIKVAFSGIFNMATFLGVLIGVLVYGLVWKIYVRFEGSKDLDCIMKLIGSIQFYLGTLRNKWARKFTNWLWIRIISLDCKKYCRLAIHSADKRHRVWLILQLPYLGHRKKIIARTCRAIASTPGISEEEAKAAQICIKKVEEQE